MVIFASDYKIYYDNTLFQNRPSGLVPVQMAEYRLCPWHVYRFDRICFGRLLVLLGESF